MDEKNLMVGDIVKGKNGEVCTVLGVSGGFVILSTDPHNPYECSEIEPVGLTEDIIRMLDWNEVKEGDDGYEKGVHWTRKQFKNIWYTTTLNIRINVMTGMMWIVDGEIYVRNLNDLQHVLRMTVKDEIIIKENGEFAFDFLVNG